MLRILKCEIRKKKHLSLKATGVSMLPQIKQGDSVTIQEKKVYNRGDVVVFLYNGIDLLMHRIVRKTPDAYWCKGDNSFRIESVKADEIVGYVTDINGTQVEAASKEFVDASLHIGMLFVRNNYDVVKVMLKNEYIEYKKKYIDI